MTNEQKLIIQQLRDRDLTYSVISAQLHISENTIKSFCRRIKIKTQIKKSSYGDFCKNCGKKLNRNPKHKVQKFCSDDCRFSWWSKNKDLMKKDAVYKLICTHCGIEFESYGNKHRKYCGHACYIEDRFEVDVSDVTRAI